MQIRKYTNNIHNRLRKSSISPKTIIKQNKLESKKDKEPLEEAVLGGGSGAIFFVAKFEKRLQKCSYFLAS